MIGKKYFFYLQRIFSLRLIDILFLLAITFMPRRFIFATLTFFLQFYTLLLVSHVNIFVLDCIQKEEGLSPLFCSDYIILYKKAYM
jgi:hypothetical protein